MSNNFVLDVQDEEDISLFLLSSAVYWRLTTDEQCLVFPTGLEFICGGWPLWVGAPSSKNFSQLQGSISYELRPD